MDAVTIETDALRGVVLPGYGARVVSLCDKVTGREWMFPGGQSPNTAEDAVYLADEAVGWDECFPTVSRWDATQTGWGRHLRDHGDLWGRPWRLDSATSTELSTTYEDSQFRFTRRLVIAGRTLHAHYEVENTSNTDLPFLWALHGLLTVTPDDRILMPDTRTVASSFLSIDGRTTAASSLAWPGPSDPFPVALDQVQPASAHIAAKLYASQLNWVGVGHGESWLKLSWEKPISDLGIWYNYGAWPVAGDLHHIALEPTSAPAGHVGEVVQSAAPTVLAAGQTTRWVVALAFSATAPGP